MFVSIVQYIVCTLSCIGRRRFFFFFSTLCCPRISSILTATMCGTVCLCIYVRTCVLYELSWCCTLKKNDEQNVLRGVYTQTDQSPGGTYVCCYSNTTAYIKMYIRINMTRSPRRLYVVLTLSSITHLPYTQTHTYHPIFIIFFSLRSNRLLYLSFYFPLVFLTVFNLCHSLLEFFFSIHRIYYC